MNKFSFNGRLFVYILQCVIMLFLCLLREMLSVVLELPQTNSMTQNQVRKKIYILNNRNTYKVMVICNLYLLNTTNAFIFNSFNLFPIGWLSLGLLIIIIETSPNTLHAYLLPLFGLTKNDITFYNFLYNSIIIVLAFMFEEFIVFTAVMSIVISSYAEEVRLS
jgi:hypothetical protein